MAMQNLKVRTIITVVGIPVLILIILYTQWIFSLMFLVFGGLILREILRIMSQRKRSPNVPAGFILYLTVALLVIQGRFDDLPALMILSAIIIMVWEMFRKRTDVYENVSISFFASSFVGLFAGMAIRLHMLGTDDPALAGIPFGPRVLMSIFAGVWMCDILAYLIGSAIGKHKIFPRVSPNKSWEGTLAGLLGAVGLMLLIRFTAWMPEMTSLDAMALGLITGGLGQAGDFAESLVKRDAGIKDSSNLLPGHGGAWDRMDSLLFAIPAGYLYVTYFMVLPG